MIIQKGQGNLGANYIHSDPNWTAGLGLEPDGDIIIRTRYDHPGMTLVQYEQNFRSVADAVQMLALSGYRLPDRAND